LVDALDSGSSAGSGMQVRFLSRALKNKVKLKFSSAFFVFFIKSLDYVGKCY